MLPIHNILKRLLSLKSILNSSLGLPHYEKKEKSPMFNQAEIEVSPNKSLIKVN